MDTRPPKLNAQIYAEASEWFVDFRDGEPDEATRRAFDSWLRKSPEHLSAYLEIAAIWSDGPRLDSHQHWTRDRLIEQARPGDDNVVPFVSKTSESAPRPVAAASGARLRLAFALGAACLVLGLVVILRHSDGTTYDTRIGEQRSVALPDGSTVDLNSRSKIEIRYSELSREVELIAGQALFNVTRDPARPFVVTSGNTRVRAVGTQFDVYRKPRGTVVTVLEGRVAIQGELTGGDGRNARGRTPTPVSLSPDAAGSTEVVLNAGGQVVVTGAAIRETERPNVTGAIAWRQRQLVFESAPLAEVAEEFNRYNTRQLVIQDRELDDFFISGVFSSTDPASLIRFLRDRPEVHVTETSSEIQVTKSSR
jgi:transmembrane sensor